jgi:uncharacterized membrane protein YphA (DoxX/SURF4 family)
VEALVGPVVVIDALLVLAGGFKLVRPAPTAGALRSAGLPSSRAIVRALAIVEIVVGAASAITIAPAWLALAGALYVGFAAFVVRALAENVPVQSCGCFGQVDTPPSGLHVLVNVLSALVLFVAAATQPPTLARVVSDQPWAGVPFFLLIAVCTYLCVVILTVLPMAFGSRAHA